MNMQSFATALVVATFIETTLLMVLKLRQRNPKVARGSILLDTSSIMDGRIVDVARSGVITAEIIIPRSVVRELQLLADKADHDKRLRARKGLDNIRVLQRMDAVSVAIVNDGLVDSGGVDERLLELAQKYDASIATTDYNLNKVAQVEGIQILNINELAKSLRMSYLPGDELMLELTQKGQDSHQAVGYLHDGTMVVVEQAKKFIGQEKRVEIIRSLQTDAGKMMFAKLVVEPKTASRTKASNNSHSAVSSAAAAKSRSTGRRPQQSQPRKTTKANSSTVKKRSSAKSKTPAEHEADLVDLANSQ